MTAALPATKRCTGPCGRVLPLEAFSKDRRARDGRRSRCKECEAARDASHRAKRKEAGLCANCPAPAVPGTTRCLDHAATQRAYDAARRAADPEGENARVAASQRRAYAAARAEGKCTWGHGRGCQAPAEDGLSLCPAHRAEQAARDARRSARQTAAMLADAAEWDIYCCHLCGLDIEPGDVLHRDHIVPVKHGGVDRCESTGATMLRPSHAFCNTSRGDEHILTAVARLNPFLEGRL